VSSDPADRRLVIGGDSGRLEVVDYSGTVVETLTDAGSAVNDAWFSPDGRSVLAGRADGSLTLWGPDRHPMLVKPVDFKPVYNAVFDSSGSRIASADSSGRVDVFDIHGRDIAVLRGHEGPAGSVRFGGDGGQVISTGVDGTVRVWDIATQAPLMTFENTDGTTTYVDVSPDGSTILKSSESGQAIRLLSCNVCGSLSSVVRLARSHAFRTLTSDEAKRYSTSG
jgi:WD40 repeat protein